MELVANRSVVEHGAAPRPRQPPQQPEELGAPAARRARSGAANTEFSVEDKGRQVPVTVAPCATVLAVLDALAADRPRRSVPGRPHPLRHPRGRGLRARPGDAAGDQAGRPLGSGQGRVRRASPRPGPHEEGQPLGRRGAARRPARRRLAAPVRDRAQPGHRAEPAGRHPPGHRGRRRLPGRRRRPAPVDHRPRRRRDLPPPPRGRTDRAHRRGWRRPRAASRTWSSRWPPPARSPTRSPSASPPPLSTVRRSTRRPRARNRRAARTRRFVARVRAEERYLGGTSPDTGALRAFGEAAESLVTRWADNGHAVQAAALCERAEAILAELAGTEDGKQALASRSRVLEAGLDARFTALADALTTALAGTGGAHRQERSPPPRRRSPRSARTAASGTATPRSAPPPTPCGWPAGSPPPRNRRDTLAEAATRMLRSWAWADRALASIARADTGRVPRLAQVYATLWDRARGRRAQLDADFARGSPPGRRHPRRPMTCCSWRTCSTGSRAR